MLAAGTNAQSVLRFGRVHGRAQVAVDSAGNVYVVSVGGEVLKMAAGASNVTVPSMGLNDAEGVAVDNAGNVYVSGFGSWGSGVVELAVGSATPTVLPLPGFYLHPYGVAVDSAGAVYLSGNEDCRICSGDEHHRVLKLAAE